MFLLARRRPTSSLRSPGPARPASTQPQPARPPLGNQVLQRLLRSGGIQARLTVNQPGDSYEQEADRVAESVMRMPAISSAAAPAITPLAASGLQRKCAECAAEEEQVQWEATGPRPMAESPRVEAQVRSLEGGGSALAWDVRGFFEPRFGRDLSAVRIHTEGPAAESARQLQARAYTRGRHIVFAAGEYSPHSSAGRRLLAHELTHVAQQAGRGEGAQAAIQRACTTSNKAGCTEEDLLTAVCIGEAGNVKDSDGQQGPINVVQNRVTDGKFGKDIRAVATATGQFQGLDNGINNLNNKAFASCRPLAQGVLAGTATDPTLNAVFFDQDCRKPCSQFCTGYLGDGKSNAHFFARRATSAEQAVCKDKKKNPSGQDKRCCKTGRNKGAVPTFPDLQAPAKEETPDKPAATDSEAAEAASEAENATDSEAEAVSEAENATDNEAAEPVSEAENV